MTAAVAKALSDPPDGEEDLLEKRKAIGRRQVARRQSKSITWPQGDIKQQRELFDTWHGIAMQALHEAKLSFRVIASFHRVINWKVGQIWATDQTFAALCGGCDTKTISRDVDRYAALGIIAKELGWRKDRNGKVVRTRTITLTFPADFDFGKVPAKAFETDISGTDHRGDSGPDGAANHEDSSGPDDWPEMEDVIRTTVVRNHMDTSGPITFEDTSEGVPSATDNDSYTGREGGGPTARPPSNNKTDEPPILEARCPARGRPRVDRQRKFRSEELQPGLDFHHPRTGKLCRVSNRDKNKLLIVDHESGEDELLIFNHVSGTLCADGEWPEEE